MFQIGRAGHNNNILKKAHLKRAARFGWVGGSSREREREELEPAKEGGGG